MWIMYDAEIASKIVLNGNDNDNRKNNRNITCIATSENALNNANFLCVHLFTYCLLCFVYN